MTISELGSIGEFVSSIAILITLAYLAIQIRENTKTNRVAARQHFADQITSFYDDFVRDSELRNLHRRGLDVVELDKDEQERFEILLSKSFVFMSSQHYQHHIGAMDEETWQEAKFYMNWYATRPGVWRWWPNNKAVFSPSFQTYMDRAVTREQGRTA